MLFSFIIPYRNREISRVRNCLQSIQNQTFQDFEVIFTDYGSDLPQKQAIESVCKEFSKVQYFYYDTRYQFWSRSHAINLGVRKASGVYLVIVDIDLIYSPHFAHHLSTIIDENTFVQYQCYYLPADLTDFQSLDFQKDYALKHSKMDTGAGLIIIPKKIFVKIGGYDEYFFVWGVEDMDMKNRLLKLGTTNKFITIKDVKNFHQWHAPANQVELMPALWMVAMENYAQKQGSVYRIAQSVANNEQRKALILGTQNAFAPNFEFTTPIMQSFLLFQKKFEQLQGEDGIYISQSFQEINVGAKSKLGGLFLSINTLLEKLKISYRITELAQFETELLNFITVRDFLFYFVAENRDKIKDYFFYTDKKFIKVIIIKN